MQKEPVLQAVTESSAVYQVFFFIIEKICYNIRQYDEKLYK